MYHNKNNNPMSCLCLLFPLFKQPSSVDTIKNFLSEYESIDMMIKAEGSWNQKIEAGTSVYYGLPKH